MEYNQLAMNPSEFENKYFIDAHRFNCAFCHVRSIGFIVTNLITFDWSPDKKVYAYFIRCLGCGNTSMHLSYFLFTYDENDPEDAFSLPPMRMIRTQQFPQRYYITPKDRVWCKTSIRLI